MALEYVKSSKGKDLLVLVGYLFETDYIKNVKMYWEYIKYNTDKDLGWAHTKDDSAVHHKDEDNHILNSAKIGTKKLIQKIKKNVN